MAHLFPEIKTFQAALKEECSRKCFMEAVFNESVLYTNGYFCLMKARKGSHITKNSFRQYFGKHLNAICLCDEDLYSYSKHEPNVTKLEKNPKNSDFYELLKEEISSFDENKVYFATDDQHIHIEGLRGCAYNKSSKVSSKLAGWLLYITFYL